MSGFSWPSLAARVRRLGCACVVAALAAGSTTAALGAQGRGTRVPSDSPTIVPGGRFGPIEETTSRDALDTIFGASRVRDGQVDIGEGICAPGVHILAGTPDALALAWQDAGRTRVAFVRASSAGGRWVTARGVRIGTTLRELERLAGRVLTFSGFGWDYGGGLNWREGTGELGLRLDIDPRDDEIASTAPDARSIFGDRLVASDHPLIRKLRVVVGEITYRWGNHSQERDCG